MSGPVDDDAERLARLVALKNVGEKTARWMIDLGIDSPEKLAEIGPVEAWRRLKAAHPRAMSMCGLWALEGALTGVAANHVDAGMRARLKAALADADTLSKETGMGDTGLGDTGR